MHPEKIPMTLKAYQILKRQLLWKRGVEAKGYKASEGFEDLVFTTTKNTPISPRDTTVVMKYIFKRIALKEHHNSNHYHRIHLGTHFQQGV